MKSLPSLGVFCVLLLAARGIQGRSNGREFIVDWLNPVDEFWVGCNDTVTFSWRNNEHALDLWRIPTGECPSDFNATGTAITGPVLEGWFTWKAENDGDIEVFADSKNCGYGHHTTVHVSCAMNNTNTEFSSADYMVAWKTAGGSKLKATCGDSVTFFWHGNVTNEEETFDLWLLSKPECPEEFKHNTSRGVDHLVRAQSQGVYTLTTPPVAEVPMYFVDSERCSDGHIVELKLSCPANYSMYEEIDRQAALEQAYLLMDGNGDDKAVGQILEGGTHFYVGWSYPPSTLKATCGDHVTFGWKSNSTLDLWVTDTAECPTSFTEGSRLAQLMEATTKGNYTYNMSKITSPMSLYFTDSATCKDGHVMLVEVACGETKTTSGDNSSSGGVATWVWVLVGIGAAAVVGGIAFFIIKKKRSGYQAVGEAIPEKL